MKHVEPIQIAHLFPELHAELIALLRGLAGEDWNKPTAAGAWTVKDVAAHLLDTQVRRLSFGRDHMPFSPPDRPIEGYADLVAFLNELNAVWVRAAKRISPRVLIDFLEITGPEAAQLFASLDPVAPGIPVSWAGEESSANWFDVAREYTEWWHHQQQIRDAVGAPGLTSRRLMHPVLDTFLRGLPHAYGNVPAEDGAAVAVEITGEAGGRWALVREDGRWQLYEGKPEAPSAGIRLDPDTAWRRMTKGITKEQAAEQAEILGDRSLGEPMLGMLSVMA
jgi:uncharacterized protein (TIGR03083 family)